ncbi:MULTISPECIES: shikimate dehydrogenase [Carboxydocella]|uniref:Predicted amino acid dehydrogenase n=2 Tax=Carboxydocella TaxID=178898 RepID=A0A1T4RMP5_9FIRM|nr:MULTISPECIES: shikimate dehydrogenase [Carboxydocella]AVX19321.1 putative amino acid dehydrogenase [Carboxydocella thermautotrophica]AVX29735.1 putative amino acid dehydrogenase [Carboxydocella thermautotrophica]GAW30390.1 shikimate dehydrogenase [Carboxydocella sp. JDF658]SKA16951.1 Predicted amino acid dehydrogenase [Carboxydocella sporoproducens DSM 16521]
MSGFAFILHPLKVGDYYRKFPWARFLPEKWAERGLAHLPPLVLGKIEGLPVEGWLISCPLTTTMLVNQPYPKVHRVLLKSGQLATKLGAKIVGLGAFTAVVGNGGRELAEELPIAVTTGNSYTVATAVEGLETAAKLVGYDISKEEVAVIGATGSIGRVCAFLLARKFPYLNLVGRDQRKLERVARDLLRETGVAAAITTDVAKALRRSALVISATSSRDVVIHPAHLRPGAIVCDVARPRDVAREVNEARPDVLVIDGGLVEGPAGLVSTFNFGLPAGTFYACMAETMILALEGHYQNYSLGKELTIEQVEKIAMLAQKHGFRLSRLRSFDQPLAEEKINRIKTIVAAYNNGRLQPLNPAEFLDNAGS